MPRTSQTRRRDAARRRLVQRIRQSVSRFQDVSYAFDDLAAEILALSRADLAVMTLLLFNGPGTAEDLARALHVRLAHMHATVDRLQLAGYARFQPGSRSQVELTVHARRWIERIWAPLRQQGGQLLDRYSTAHLTVIATFLQRACDIQDGQATELRAWLAQPTTPARRSHLRGGLSPAAWQRVQVFVEANLGAPLRLQDLAARAALSPYHFARAFKTSAGMTPRAFVEQRRVERAKTLLTTSPQPIAIVAQEAGFGTQSRLTTTFRRHTGSTPAVYRRGHT